MALWTKQGVFAKAVKETLLKRLCRQHLITSGISVYISGDDLGKLLSDLLVTHVAMQTVITDSVKTFWQNMLCHASNELQNRKCFMLDLPCFVITIPIADGLSVIPFDPANRDRRRDDILCQILSQPLSALRHFCRLNESDKTLWISFPCPINIFFNIGIANILSDHFEKMILPFSVHQIVRDVRDAFPLFGRVNSACCHEYMKVRVVMTGSSSGLKNYNVSDIEFCAGAGFENVFEAGVACLHEMGKQCWIAIKPFMQEIRHCQYDMAISYPGQQTSADEVCPSVGIDFSAGKTEAGFAGKSDASGFTAIAASVLYKAHLFRIAAVEHFLNGIIVIRAVKAWMTLLECIPVIVKNLLENIFINAFHGCFVGTTITK